MTTATSDPVGNVLERLQSARKVGKNQWIAKCPAHDDRHPSLSIGRGDGGRVLLTCQTGCTLDSICSALLLEK